MKKRHRGQKRTIVHAFWQVNADIPNIEPLSRPWHLKSIEMTLTPGEDIYGMEADILLVIHRERSMDESWSGELGLALAELLPGKDFNRGTPTKDSFPFSFSIQFVRSTPLSRTALMSAIEILTKLGIDPDWRHDKPPIARYAPIMDRSEEVWTGERWENFGTYEAVRIIEAMSARPAQMRLRTEP